MTDAQKWWWLISAAALLLLLYLLAPVLTPFFAAALLAYLGDPLVDRLQTRGMRRTSAVVLVFLSLLLLIVALVAVVVPVLQQELVSFARRLPEYIAWLQDAVLPWIQELLPPDWVVLDVEHLKQVVTEHWRQAGGAAAELVSGISQSGMTLFGWLANLVLIPVLTFYLLRDWDVLMSQLRALIPRRHEVLAVRLGQECDQVLGAFLRGQLAVMLALSVVYALGLLLVGIEGALLIGVAAGLLSFVPYLGFALGIIVAGVTALVQFQDLLHVLLVLAVFGFGQMLESAVLTPYLLGDRIGLHPVAVIFSVMAGGQLFGFVGILLALPTAAVMVVLLRYAHARYRDSQLYADGGQG